MSNVKRHHITHGAYNRYASASKQKYLSKMSARENEIPDLSENVNSRLEQEKNSMGFQR